MCLLNPVSFLKKYLKHKGEIGLNRSLGYIGPSIFSTVALKSNLLARQLRKLFEKGVGTFDNSIFGHSHASESERKVISYTPTFDLSPKIH